MKQVALLIWILSSFCCKSQQRQNTKTDIDSLVITRLDGSIISSQELDKQIQTLVNAANVTGITVTVFNNDTVTYQNAFGYANLEKRDSLWLDHVFYGASLSKSVFGYLVAQLAREKIIDLDKPLQEYFDVPIPEMKFEKEWKGYKDLASDERYKKITARMCMSHTTGFQNWRWISRTGEFTPEGKIQIFFEPGTSYSYSGEGMMLLQYAIEHITGKGLEQLAKERIFDPLGMTMSSYIHQPRFDDVYCNGHTKAQEVIKKDISDETAAAGSMSTTAVDYAKFMSHILSLASQQSPIVDIMFKPNISIKSKKQFGPLSLEQTNDNDKIDLNYGLGWGILSSPYGKGYFKEGHGEGFQHYSIIFPGKKLGVLLMSNSDNAESIFKYLLDATIKDNYTSWYWEDYIPYDH